MALTVLAAPTLFRGDNRLARWYFYMVPVASATLSPTRAEMALTTTIDVTAAVYDWGDFTTDREVSSATILGGDNLPQQVDGPRTSGSPWMEFYADILGADIQDTIDEADAIDIQRLPSGDVAAAKAQVWRVSARSIVDQNVKADLDRIRIMFNLKKDNKRVTIPALS